MNLWDMKRVFTFVPSSQIYWWLNQSWLMFKEKQKLSDIKMFFYVFNPNFDVIIWSNVTTVTTVSDDAVMTSF